MIQLLSQRQMGGDEYVRHGESAKDTNARFWCLTAQGPNFIRCRFKPFHQAPAVAAICNLNPITGYEPIQIRCEAGETWSVLQGLPRKLRCQVLRDEKCPACCHGNQKCIEPLEQALPYLMINMLMN